MSDGGLGTIRGLRATCERIRAVLEDSPELATPEEVAAYWPGGSRNPHGRSRSGWTYAYGQLCAFLRRGEVTPSQYERIESIAEDAARDAQRGAPEYVDLDAPMDPADPDRGRKQIAVFPKSFHALCYIQDYDENIRRCLMTYHELREHTHELYARHGQPLLDRVSHYERLLCWVVTHEPAGLPFGDSEADPTPPAWTLDLSPRDIVAIVQAHKFVNGARAALALRLLETPGSLAPSGSAERMTSWKTLLALAGKELGVPVRSLARDHTLESIVAQLAVARRAELEAERRGAPVGAGLGSTRGAPDFV